jgi:predicted nuclease of predicted toxin-antitoxin system
MLIVDAQLSPHLAPWINQNFNIEAYSVSFLNFKTGSDIEIFNYAKSENAIVITKDDDFVRLLELYGSPPKIIWITCGNTSNEKMKGILKAKLSNAIALLNDFDLIEIAD